MILKRTKLKVVKTAECRKKVFIKISSSEVNPVYNPSNIPTLVMGFEYKNFLICNHDLKMFNNFIKT